MPEIDGYSDILSPEMRAAWPVLSATVRRLRGSLVGGTALAVKLRHRESFDLDYMTTVGFSGQRLARRLMDASHLPCTVAHARTDSLHASVSGVAVQIFRTPHRGTNPGHVKQLAPPTAIDGLRVAALPDLLAMKLDVIMYRPKLRDYIDIAAIDRSGIFTIEDGLRFHAERYGTAAYGFDAESIVRLLESPGQLAPDRVFEHSQDEVLAYLEERSAAVRTTMSQEQPASPAGKSAQPTLRPSVRTAGVRCNAWMPIARARCCLPKGHGGHHRSA